MTDTVPSEFPLTANAAGVLAALRNSTIAVAMTANPTVVPASSRGRA